MNFKVKYIAGGFRTIMYKILLQNRICYNSFFQYIGKNCVFSVASNSRVIIGHKNYFTNNIYLGVHDGGILKIGNNNFFNRGITIECLESISIGDNCLFGPNIVVVDHDHKFDNVNQLICKQGYRKESIQIGSDVWIGANVTICKGVKICDRVVVGANSVVKNSITSPGVYVGIPAKKIKEI